ncbi:ribosome maturation factor RimP [Fundidesulfovibrio butyratiphilus]
MSMDNQATLDRLRELAEPFVQTLGLTLWGLEIAGGAGRPLVRLFLDSPQGVDVEQCAQVSRQVGLALDVEDLIRGSYQLEVSSPGLERRFFAFSQLAPYVGRVLDVTLAAPVEGRKRFRGLLAELGADDFRLDCEGVSFRFAWADVSKARLVHEFETPKPPRGGRRD